MTGPVRTVVDRVERICTGTFAALDAMRSAAASLVLPFSEGAPPRRSDIAAVTHRADVRPLWSGVTGADAELHRVADLPLGVLTLTGDEGAQSPCRGPGPTGG